MYSCGYNFYSYYTSSLFFKQPSANDYNMYILFFSIEKVQQIRGTVSSSMFGGDRGEISSPNFPDRYALNDETFTYIITNLDPYGKIRIIFDDWDLASVSTLQV